MIIEGGPTGHITIRIVTPPDAHGPLPVVLYIHGAAWVFGRPDTHDRLVRELAVGAHAALIVPHYDRSPEAKYPTAIEQCWATAQWIMTSGSQHGLDATPTGRGRGLGRRDMATVITLLAKQRGGVTFEAQALFYPVTDANFDTGSYHQFAQGYYLSREGMQWFFDQYTTDPAERADITVSPLRATSEQLSGLPPALVITGEADALRDEGELYADHLRSAGVPVTAARYAGILHDLVMLNVLRPTRAAEAAIAVAINFLARNLQTN